MGRPARVAGRLETRSSPKSKPKNKKRQTNKKGGRTRSYRVDGVRCELVFCFFSFIYLFIFFAWQLVQLVGQWDGRGRSGSPARFQGCRLLTAFHAVRPAATSGTHLVRKRRRRRRRRRRIWSVSQRVRFLPSWIRPSSWDPVADGR